MRQHLADLNEIQKIDLGIREHEKRLQALPERLRQLEAQSATLRTEVEKLTTERNAMLAEASTLTEGIQAETQKLRKWEVRLNEIRNQREYLALSREVEGSKRQNRDSEERINELNTQREMLEKKLDELQDQLAELEVDCSAERQKVEAAQSELKKQLEGEITRREALYPKIPKPLLKKYATIRDKRVGIGLALVVDGRCRACNMKLPPQLYNILQRGETIEQCPSCQRIIFWEQHAGGAEASAAPTP